MMRRALLLLAFLLLAAPARAGHVTVGSSLKAKATRYESAPVDTVYWNTKLAGHRRVKVPARGELKVVRVKGRVNKSGDTPPNVQMHIQALRRVAGGKVKVAWTTEALALPLGGRAQRITTYHLPPDICVRRGDYLALATNGGYGEQYPDGAQFAMFASVQGSAFDAFTGAGQDMNGSVFSGTTHVNRELLLQAKIATGKSAHSFCTQ
jgi:hypothetical protein